MSPCFEELTANVQTIMHDASLQCVSFTNASQLLGPNLDDIDAATFNHFVLRCSAASAVGRCRLTVSMPFGNRLCSQRLTI